MEITTIAIPVKLDVSNTVEIKEQIRVAIEDNGCRKMIIDLAETTFIDSSGLAALISGLKTMRAQGGTLVVANMGEQARTIFDLTRMDLVFSIYATTAEATAALEA